MEKFDEIASIDNDGQEPIMIADEDDDWFTIKQLHSGKDRCHALQMVSIEQ